MPSFQNDMRKKHRFKAPEVLNVWDAEGAEEERDWPTMEFAEAS